MPGFLRALTGWFQSAPRPRPRAAFQLEKLEDRMTPTASNLAAPIFNSLSGAPASLYLDFTGLPTQTWGSYQNVNTPVFHLDGSGSLFTANEVAVISEVWQRVAEMYSPFDINVTTAAPANLSHGKTQIVAIGGSYNDWFHQAAGGISYVGAFTNAYEPNISHVFVDGTAGVAKDIAIAAAHEAGHAFGLSHQSTFNGAGQLTQEYNPGDSASAPIMGLAYNAARALWSVGYADVNGAAAIQNDEAVIAGSTNGFGYRPDYYGQSFAAATPLTVLSGQPGAVGVLDAPTSIDYFSFTTSGGAVSLSVTTAAVGPTLHARLELYSGSTLIAVSDSPTTLAASISTSLAAGHYYVLVRSNGDYGDVGQYALSVNAPTSGSVPGGVPSQATTFTLTSDHALWAVKVAAQTSTLLSPAGTILAISPSKDASGHDIVFALASDHSLWVYNPTGWVMLSPGGTISDLSASTNSIVFALASDHSLWEHGQAGWAILSPAATINSMSASPGDVVFALASDHSLWRHNSAGWLSLSPSGTILSVNAGTDSAGGAEATVVASDYSLWQFDKNVWQMLAPAGSTSPASPTTPSATLVAPTNGGQSALNQAGSTTGDSNASTQNKSQQATGVGADHTTDGATSDAGTSLKIPTEPYIPMCMCPACIAARKAAAVGSNT
jgi:Metallo-peptidase family M12B Reprolysin-like